ncbi:MAG TPA: DUF4349 domain-containing protein [Gemmatimonadaceae bacterium]|nr:DUF4349 domain-containing protein [Gemmatimonadaceae bacterium]
MSIALATGCAVRGNYPGPSPTPIGERVTESAKRAEGTAQSPEQLPERMLVQRAHVRMESEDLPALRRRAEAMATALGGFVQDAEIDEKRSLRMQLRVPAPALEAGIDTLRHAGKLKSETRQALDVTEQVVDADARLRNLIATRDRLREHLARSATVADAVAAERELSRVQGEIDALEARLKHLRGTVSLAELNVSATRSVVLGPLGWVAVGAGWVVRKLFVWKY